MRPGNWPITYQSPATSASVTISIAAPSQERPWQATAESTSWDDLSDDPETRAAANQLNAVILDHYVARARGGVGLLILETSAVAWPVGATSLHQPARLAVSAQVRASPRMTSSPISLRSSGS